MLDIEKQFKNSKTSNFIENNYEFPKLNKIQENNKKDLLLKSKQEIRNTKWTLLTTLSLDTLKIAYQ